MQPWTATGFILGACGLGLNIAETPAARLASATCAIAMALVSGLHLLQHLAGNELGIDTWLFPTSILTAQPHVYPNPGRMSQAAAIGQTALAGALLLASQAKGPIGRAAFSTLATAALAEATLGILRYVLRLEPLDAWFPANPLALHSALALAALSVGVLALRPDVGWMRIAAQQGPIGWTAAMLFAAGGLLLVSGTDAATRTGRIAIDTAEAFRRLEIIVSILKDAKTGQRGYLLTNKDGYLAPYLGARNRLPDLISKAATSLAAVKRQEAELTSLRNLITLQMKELSDTIQLYQTNHPEEALRRLEADLGRSTMDGIRNEVDILLQGATSDAEKQVMRARRVATMAAAGIILLAGLAVWALAAARRGQRHALSSLAASALRQQDLLVTLGLGTFMAVNLDGVIQYWAEGCERLYGWTAQEAVGRWATEMLNPVYPIPQPEIIAILHRTGEWNGQVRHRTRDGRQLVVTVHKVLRRPASGQQTIVLEALTDVTAQSRAEAALRDNQTLLRTIIETTPGLIYAKDSQGRMLMANSAAAALIGKPWTEVVGRTDREFLNDFAQGEIVMANDRWVMETGQTQELEERVSEPNGQVRVWLSIKTPMQDSDGTTIGLVGVSIDITERNRNEERLRLMVNELNHRVKNTLATVQSITSQTLRGTDQAIRHTLEGRLQALAAVHDVLTRESWREASLHKVIEGALVPYGGTASARFEIAGEPIRLQPRVAVALSLALHELATNANKYGALSTAQGQIAIRWNIVWDNEPRLHMVWSETGGPRVVPVKSRGFGMRLIERSLAQDLGGTAQLLFNTEGVICIVDTILSEVEATAEIIVLSHPHRMAGD